MYVSLILLYKHYIKKDQVILMALPLTLTIPPKHQISGREMFEFNPDLQVGDDADASGALVREVTDVSPLFACLV